ncbi:putative sulfate exporter family transporter [Phyllobacterium phragmitis]|uniref:Putative sulfate exporter family transporter n=1 Tax=Phyllobacterium phragmitis TaxID=2670329 RepID=A0A2S9IUG1_9HYPH|nr:putative sulfate exporter family transporter [Phyllobacterium phragmitis]PRD44169.1 putative sulfate exporter family transporter [Phyllobacterium phragmitis]
MLADNHLKIGQILPGIFLSGAVAGLAVLLQMLEVHLIGQAWLEGLVLAILIGTAIRTFYRPSARFDAGVGFSAKTLLEIAIVLLGASVSTGAVIAAGPGLILGIVGVVAVAIVLSYGIGRLLRLPHRMAVLVACGNSICGNSAIAATAPVIGAHGDDVAASIAFTAVLGVVVVLCLPLLVPLLGLSITQYGVLAGLTVYAVPQVLAATAPVAQLSVQLGTLVKLVRVLMLGPVILALALLGERPGEGRRGARPSLRHLVPWFIIGFLAMMALRSLGFIPAALHAPIEETSTFLTIISMAALGLGVDVRTVMRAGGRVTLTAILSLLALGVVSYGLILMLGV